MTEPVKKARYIAENDPDLVKTRELIAEYQKENEESKENYPQKVLYETTSIRLTEEIITKIKEFLRQNERFQDRSALIRAILVRFFNENDPDFTRIKEVLTKK